MSGKRLHLSSTETPIVIDDFNLIHGIGPAIETRLHNAGILTFAQLSWYSPEKIADVVTGLSVQRIIKEKWISQATQLARKNTVARPRKGKVVPRRRQHYANFTVELLEIGDAHRTNVVHVESGETETWPSWDTKRVIDFFASHMGVPSLEATSYHQEIVKPRKKTAAIILNKSIHKISEAHQLPPPPSANSNIAGRLHLIDLQVVPVGSNNPCYVLQHDQPFVVRLTLDFAKVVAPKNVTLFYKATVVAKRLGGPQQIIGETSGSLKRAAQATIEVASISLPLGTYRMDALVNIASSKTKPDLVAFLKGKILQIY